MQNLSEYLSIVFASLDPTAWERYRQAYIKTANVFVSLQAYDRCPIQCFVGYYLLINILTTIHWDTKDPPDGWVAIVTTLRGLVCNSCISRL